MPNTKTWVVNSATSRHPELDGETVPLEGVFSNGMGYPGDPAGGAEQTAGCTCTVDYDLGTGDQAEALQLDAGIAHEWGAREYAGWADELTDSQVLAIDEYQNVNFAEINGALREGDVGDLTGFVRELDLALEAAETPAQVAAFRRGQLPAGLQPGQAFIDKGFTSTTLVDGWLREGTDAAMMRITVPKGYSAAYLDAGTGVELGEWELLLRRGTVFRYDGEIDGVHQLMVVAQ